MSGGQAATPPPGRKMSVVDALKLAASHQAAGRLQNAEIVLRQLLQQRPNQSEALHMLALLAHQVGKLPIAIDLLERALAIHPNVGLYQANIAEMYRRAGNSAQAIAHGERAIALTPGNAEAHNNLGIAHYDRDDFEGAIRCYSQAIAIKPRFAEAMSNRGNALRGLRRFEEAEGEYRRALAINPAYPEAYNNLGSVLRDLERPAEAEVAYKKALSLSPNYLEAANNLILAYRDLKKLDEAYEAAQAALRLSPQNPDALTYLASIYIEQKKTDQAFETLRRSMAINPNKAESYNMLGRAHFDAAEADKAVEAYNKAIALKKDFADAHNNLGSALKELGRFGEAIDAFNRALAIQPTLVGAYVNLADTKKFRSSDDPDLIAMEGLAEKIEALPEERQQHLHFGLAKAYDDLERYDEAFTNMRRGNALKRKSISYDESTVLGYFERVKQMIGADVVREKSGGGFATRQPIFVLGMPRSGTTLIEQIIASHPTVRGGGELKLLSETVNSVRDRQGNQAPYPDFVPAMSPRELTQFGESYARGLSRYARCAAHVTDKMPSNFYFLGLIHSALPQAKIIHANRSPIDTCLSCFSKLFAGEQSQTYDLAELGRYYRAYHGLMAHWRQVLPPGAFLDVQYEEVVGDVETQARRILDYCDLDWDPRVLDFHKTERPVKTASASQVRKPIYGSSVARWRHYERHLGPLIAELGDLAR